MNSRQARRIEIINRIRNTIRENTVKEEPFIAKIALETGLSRRTVKEYVDLLVTAGEIKRDFGELSYQEE